MHHTLSTLCLFEQYCTVLCQPCVCLSNTAPYLVNPVFVWAILHCTSSILCLFEQYCIVLRQPCVCLSNTALYYVNPVFVWAILHRTSSTLCLFEQYCSVLRQPCVCLYYLNDLQVTTLKQSAHNGYYPWQHRTRKNAFEIYTVCDEDLNQWIDAFNWCYHSCVHLESKSTGQEWISRLSQHVSDSQEICCFLVVALILILLIGCFSAFEICFWRKGFKFYWIIWRGTQAWVILIGDLCGWSPGLVTMTSTVRPLLQAGINCHSQPDLTSHFRL
jgi:hypothetical protein